MFQIHSQLLQDCHLLGQFDTCHLLLHKNASLHWFILVPETPHQNLLELNTTQLHKIMLLSQKLNQYLMSHLGYKKINVASIGNIVEQLHLHIVGRHKHDPCWPQPVWGNMQTSKPYQQQDIDAIKQTIHSYLK